MRIALVNWSRRLEGGAETTLADQIPGLAAAGHQLALWHEMDRPAKRAVIPMPADAPQWCAEELGLKAALAGLTAWKPDVLYVHGLLRPQIERRLLDVAPAVLFAHNYYGTCISGAKTLTFPTTRPCPHRLDWRCLLRYYPRRTGGLSPVTMVRLYRKQVLRRSLLGRYRFLVVLSRHMQAEYVRHGLSPERVVLLPHPPVRMPSAPLLPFPSRTEGTRPLWRLLFVGRMDRLKGGAVLLGAAPRAARALAARLEVTLVGDGPFRRRWQRLGARVQRASPEVTVHFPGWQGSSEVTDHIRAADLLVMPSLWPEPFGRAGLEAGAYGVPTVGFATGGIPAWLKEGENGQLAPGDPPTVDGLADAIVQALHDPGHYARLREGALAAARRASTSRHVAALLEVLQRAAGRP